MSRNMLSKNRVSKKDRLEAQESCPDIGSPDTRRGSGAQSVEIHTNLLNPVEAQGVVGVICIADDESPTASETPGISITHDGRTTDLSNEVDTSSSRLDLSSLKPIPAKLRLEVGNPSPGPASSIYSSEWPRTPLPRSENGGAPQVGIAEGMSPHPLAATITARRPSVEEYNEVLGPYPSMPLPLRELPSPDPSVPGVWPMPDVDPELVNPAPPPGKGLKLSSGPKDSLSIDGFPGDKEFTGTPDSPLKDSKFTIEVKSTPTGGELGDSAKEGFPDFGHEQKFDPSEEILSPANLTARRTSRKRSNAGESSPHPLAINDQTPQEGPTDSVELHCEKQMAEQDDRQRAVIIQPEVQELDRQSMTADEATVIFSAALLSANKTQSNSSRTRNSSATAEANALSSLFQAAQVAHECWQNEIARQEVVDENIYPSLEHPNLDAPQIPRRQNHVKRDARARGNKDAEEKRAGTEIKKLEPISQSLSSSSESEIQAADDSSDDATSWTSTTTTWGSPFDPPANFKVRKANTWPRRKGSEEYSEAPLTIAPTAPRAIQDAGDAFSSSTEEPSLTATLLSPRLDSATEAPSTVPRVKDPQPVATEDEAEYPSYEEIVKFLEIPLVGEPNGSTSAMTPEPDVYSSQGEESSLESSPRGQTRGRSPTPHSVQPSVCCREKYDPVDDASGGKDVPRSKVGETARQVRETQASFQALESP
ncbi:hypothetical protein MMC30_002284 [Trapelia coarctata]|nr:hypothetical protein [Trapelia coarctata]